MRQLALLLYLILLGGVVQAQDRGVQRVLQAETRNGEQLNLYKESHALLIGVSDYTQWPRLDSIPRELDQVEQALKAHDFNVVRLNSPKARELSNGIEDFIDKFGYERENRLLIYFSGHGHSIGNKGFLIPADTPLPEDEGFRRKTVPMSRLLSWARDIEAKHVLFLLDSCFSGSVFKSRNLPGSSERYISKATAEPVRQFITAGSANQVVPAKSTFTPALIRAINGEGDLNKDGYITGSELGVHLSQVVPDYVNQNPQYGKIKDYDLAQGDFVFFGQNKRKAPPVASVSDQSLERLLWQSAERLNTRGSYQSYLDRFPNGIFSLLALTIINQLNSKIDPLTVENPLSSEQCTEGKRSLAILPGTGSPSYRGRADNLAEIALVAAIEDIGKRGAIICKVLSNLPISYRNHSAIPEIIASENRFLSKRFLRETVPKSSELASYANSNGIDFVLMYFWEYFHNLGVDQNRYHKHPHRPDVWNRNTDHPRDVVRAYLFESSTGKTIKTSSEIANFTDESARTRIVQNMFQQLISENLN